MTSQMQSISSGEFLKKIFYYNLDRRVYTHTEFATQRNASNCKYCNLISAPLFWIQYKSDVELSPDHFLYLS